MKYGYTEASEVICHVQMTANDINRLVGIVESYTGEDNKWFASNTAKTLKDCLTKMANAMETEASYLKEKTNV